MVQKEEQMAAYMNYDNVEGDVTAGSHTGWIRLNSVGWSGFRNLSTDVGKGSNREGGTRSITPMMLSKKQDLCSTRLHQDSLTKNTSYPVTIDITTTGENGAENIILRIELEEVMCGDYSIGCQSAAGTDERPMETMSFTYTKITTDFKQQAIDGTAQTDSLRTILNVATGEVS